MLTLQEVTDEYVDTHVLRTSSIKTYKAAARACIRQFGDCKADEITHRSVLAWRKKQLDSGLAKRSWNTYSTHMRTVYKYAIEQQLLDISINPFKKTSVIPPRRPKKTVVGDAIAQARSWLEFLKDEEDQNQKRAKITPAWFWLVVFETFYYTGIRLNALICVTLGDVDLKGRLIRVRAETEKTHREFMIPIPDGLLPHLHVLVQNAKARSFSHADQLFNVNRFSSHYRKLLMDVDQVEAMYKKLIDKTGVRMTPHRFRHTIASDLMKQPDRNIHVTKTLLNHTNIATTMEYIEPDYDVMRAVLNERTPIRGLVEFMEKREGYRQNLNGRSLGDSQYSVGVSRTRLLKIDRSPPLTAPKLVEKSAISTHSALALPNAAKQIRSDAIVWRKRCGVMRTPVLSISFLYIAST